MAVNRYADRPAAMNLEHAQTLARCCRVEIYSRKGRRLGILVGEDRQTLEKRVERWRECIAPNLQARWTEP
ncbi:hypothetical protein [Halomonas sp. E14]|uniref:hypothetical protein n=1 Tax=Halomonas sp. E14 TaxID=3397245 RepID=UPI00403E517E